MGVGELGGFRMGRRGGGSYHGFQGWGFRIILATVTGREREGGRQGGREAERERGLVTVVVWGELTPNQLRCNRPS